ILEHRATEHHARRPAAVAWRHAGSTVGLQAVIARHLGIRQRQLTTVKQATGTAVSPAHRRLSRLPARQQQFQVIRVAEWRLQPQGAATPGAATGGLRRGAVGATYIERAIADKDTGANQHNAAACGTVTALAPVTCRCTAAATGDQRRQGHADGAPALAAARLALAVLAGLAVLPARTATAARRHPVIGTQADTTTARVGRCTLGHAAARVTIAGAFINAGINNLVADMQPARRTGEPFTLGGVLAITDGQLVRRRRRINIVALIAQRAL